jgi:hypothetical protein
MAMHEFLLRRKENKKKRKRPPTSVANTNKIKAVMS